MEDIDVQFKWFAKIHSVMGGTVVVNLPEVLDTLDHNGQCSSSAIPDTKGKQGEQVQHPSSLLSGEQEPSAQSGRQHLSTHRGEQPVSAQNAEVPGPSSQQKGEQLWHSVTQSDSPAWTSRITSRDQSATAGS